MVSHHNESTLSELRKQHIFVDILTITEKLFCGARSDQLIKGDISEAIGSGRKLSIFEEE